MPKTHTPETAPQTSLALLDAGEAYMRSKGLSEADIDPATVALAIHKPGEVKAAEDTSTAGSVAAHVSRMHGFPVSRGLGSDNEAFRLLDSKRHELSRGSRVRKGLAVLAMSAVVAIPFVHAVGDVDASFQTNRTGDPATFDDVTYHDESFLPGDLGATNVPFLERLRTIIPGIPDRNPVALTSVETEQRETEERQVRREGTYDTADTINPASPDLSLSGTEYQLAREEAEDLVDSLGKPRRFTVTGFGAVGRVSDEYNGQLGVRNNEQNPLSLARAEVASRALEDELNEQGFEVTTGPINIGREVVLSPDQITRLEREGRLDEKLARSRGARLWVAGDKRVVTRVPHTEIVETERTKLSDQFPMEGAAALPLAVGALYGGLVAPNVAKGRRGANRVARRQLRQAERRKARSDRRADKREKVAV